VNRPEIASVLKECLASIVPGVDLDTVDPAADLRDEIELDSMDLLNLVIALHKRLGVDIPEVDVPKLVTIDGATTYLASRIGQDAASCATFV
jgi:acyl carrier protein